MISNSFFRFPKLPFGFYLGNFWTVVGSGQEHFSFCLCFFCFFRNKSKEALKSLQWLRGWVSKRVVRDEFSSLQEYREQFDTCLKCEKLLKECQHPSPSIFDKLKDISRKRTLKPFILITILYVMMEFSGMFVMRPYIVQILNAYGIPIGASSTTILLGLLGLIANIFLVFTVRVFGKRRIYLFTICGTFLCSFGLSEL